MPPGTPVFSDELVHLQQPIMHIRNTQVVAGELRRKIWFPTYFIWFPSDLQNIFELYSSLYKELKLTNTKRKPLRSFTSNVNVFVLPLHGTPKDIIFVKTFVLLL